jgi:UDP-2,4-diacetamido-2,4,6-trideoxy-beta-L-altropyranose hydrolase
MRAVIRADASVRIGTGHVMRCLALADKLRAEGADVRFICRELQGHLGKLIASRGYEAHLLPAPADSAEWRPASPAVRAGRAASAAVPAVSAASPATSADLPPHASWLESSWRQDAEQTIACLRAQGMSPDVLIVDHYALDARYERALRPHVGRILAIDDIADREHDCDWLLDCNYDTDPEARYAGLLSAGCRLLLGPRYALLREPFRAARRRVRRSGAVRRLLISFGGADATGETMKALRALEAWRGAPLAADVVIGKLNPYAAAIRERCRRIPGCEWYDFVGDMEEKMLQADLAIGSGGTTSWERCCLGLPALVVKTAANQVRLTEQLAQAGAVVDLGLSRQVTPELITLHLLRLQQEPELYKRMAVRAFGMVDGKGTERVIKELIDGGI